MLTVYHSNYMEHLADQLAAVVSSPLGPPLTPEIVIVQSNGMARWLSMHFARRLGICANVHFPFPAAFLWEVFRKVLPKLPETAGFSPAVMTWRLMDLLAGIQGDPRFVALDAYLGDGDDFRRYELAYRIADTFDQYLVYRPDWILRWEAGEGSEASGDAFWQAQLWQRLAATSTDRHRVRVQANFFKALTPLSVARAHLPARIALFGIPAMPPVYLEIFKALAEYLEVHLFLLNPCRQYWGDILPERDIARRAGEEDAESLYLETGNSLLASLGKQGRDFIDLIQECQGAEVDGFVEPGEDSLLHCLQSDILHLRSRGSPAYPATPLRPHDRSVQIHACHSPMREVEVLYDQLLALFESNPDLTPGQVAVMTPDIEAYAPYIEAVFATVDGERRIPFTIADRPIRAESPLVDAFFRLLDIVGSRFDANRVLAVLETPAVQRRFGLAEDDLVPLHRWVRETGIRWGIDPDGRARLGLPATPEHTWRAGLDRLLLGYALPGEDSHLFGEILPYDEVEGGAAQLMGRLQAFAAAIFELQHNLDARRSIADWTIVLNGILQRVLAPAEDEQDEVQALRNTLDALAQTAQQALFAAPVSLAVIKSCLRRQLELTVPPTHFLSGGVTFCAMVPMRSIPFEVLCLIGMHDGAYPRAQRPLSFDLMAYHFRRGDRSRRNDDRYLFLEALLSARRCLYLSFVGNSIRDNSVIPPSVLISELLDTLRQGFYLPGNPHGDVLEQVITRHPLQAFSRRYFSGDDRLFSYSQELCEASRAAGQGNAEAKPFITTELPVPGEEWRSVDLKQLIGFYSNPARYLLRQRLGIHLEEGEGLLETREPFILDYLADQGLRQELLTLCLAGRSLVETLPMVRAKGRLPHGQVGATLFERRVEAVAAFAARVQPVLPTATGEPLEIDLSLGKMRLIGRLSGVGQEGLVGFRIDQVRPRDLLDLWVRHLLLNALAVKGVRPVSRWLGEDKEIVLHPVAHPQRYLQDLLGHYWQGLCRPLHFFPKSACAYVEAACQGHRQPMAMARRRWEGCEYQRGECEDLYYQLAFRGSDPLDKEFIALGEAVFRPILDHLQEENSNGWARRTAP